GAAQGAEAPQSAQLPGALADGLEGEGLALDGARGLHDDAALRVELEGGPDVARVEAVLDLHPPAVGQRGERGGGGRSGGVRSGPGGRGGRGRGRGGGGRGGRGFGWRRAGAPRGGAGGGEEAGAGEAREGGGLHREILMGSP